MQTQRLPRERHSATLRWKHDRFSRGGAAIAPHTCDQLAARGLPLDLCENLRSQLDRHHCADSNLYCLQRTGTTSLQLLDRRVPSILPRVLHFVPWIVGPFPAIRAPSPGTRRLLDTRSNDGFTSTCTDIQLFACTKHVQD